MGCMRSTALALLAASALVALAAPPAAAILDAEKTVFTSFIIPNDTSGKPIHCHDGGIISVGKTYYWYGTTRKEAPDWLSEAVSLYSSDDLTHWKSEGRILEGSQIEVDGFHAPWRIERPKILYNKANDNYVLLFHVDSPSFSLSSVGVAVADQVTGPFKWVRAFKPGGLDSYDMTAFVDPNDGGAYVVNSVKNEYTGVFRLSPDYTATLGGACGRGPKGEAPAPFFPKPREYQLIASHLTGWSTNEAIQMSLASETGPCGEWRAMKPPVFGPGADKTYDSQSTFVFPIADPAGGPPLWVYMGDRWNYDGPLPGRVANATYAWFPILPLADDASTPTQYMIVNPGPAWSPAGFFGKAVLPLKGKNVLARPADAGGAAGGVAGPAANYKLVPLPADAAKTLAHFPMPAGRTASAPKADAAAIQRAVAAQAAASARAAADDKAKAADALPAAATQAAIEVQSLDGGKENAAGAAAPADPAAKKPASRKLALMR